MKTRKMQDLLKDASLPMSFLDNEDACCYVARYFFMNFTNKTVSMTNF